MLRVQNKVFEYPRINRVNNSSQKNSTISFKGEERNLDFIKLSGIKPYVDFRIQSSEKEKPKNSQESAEVAYNASKKLFDLGKYEEAKALYIHANDVNRDSLNPKDKFYREFSEFGGDIFKKIGDFDTSLKLYSGAFNSLAENDDSSNEDLVRILNKIAETHILRNDSESATGLLDDSLETSGTPALITKNLFLRGVNDISNNRLLNGENHIRLADTVERLNKVPKDNDLALSLSLIYRNNGEYEKSSDICRENLDDLSNNNRINTPQSMYSLMVLAANDHALSSENNDNLKKSISTYKNALAVSENLGDAPATNLISKTLGTIYFEQNDDENAKIYLTKVADSNNAEPELLRPAYSMLGQIYLKENNPEKAVHYLEEERKLLLVDNTETSKIGANLSNLVRAYSQLQEPAKVEQYTGELSKMQSEGQYTPTYSFEDMKFMAMHYLTSKDYKKSEKMFADVENMPSLKPEEKAEGLIIMGISQIESKDSHHGIQNMETGCEQLEKFAENPQTANLLYKSYNKLGETYYFKRNEFEKAAINFEKAKKLADKNDLVEISGDDKLKLNSKVAAAFYKAKKYDKSSEYYTEYLSGLTKEKFLYSKLDNNFVDGVINTHSPAKCQKIATALEMLGVSNVKEDRLESATLCFHAGLGIRRVVNGNKMEAANDLKALSRIACLRNFSNSKELLDQSITIMKNELGSNHPQVQKEEKFKNEYYGIKVASVSKFATRLLGGAKEAFGFENPYKKEIIDDFHLIHEDMRICE